MICSQIPSSSRAPICVSVLVEGKPLSIEVDTGASYSVISKHTDDQEFNTYQLQSSDVQLKTYTEEPLSVYGQFSAQVTYEDQSLPLKFVVAGKNGPSLLGRDWLQTLRLNWSTIFSIKNDRLSSLLDQYSDVFTKELGPLKGFKAKLFIDSHTRPIFCKARPVPYRIRPQVDSQIDKLLSQNTSSLCLSQIGQLLLSQS